MRHPGYLYIVLLGATASMAGSPPNAPMNEPSGIPATPQASLNHPDGAAVDVVEHLYSFDPMSVELAYREHHWLLLAGSQVLKDFGRRESEARQAVRLIRDLSLTQHGTVGQPIPVLEYWLSNGKAPQGSPAGVRVLPLDQASLHLDQIQAQWCLRDRQRVLFNFGLRQRDAIQALAVIQKYQFARIGLIGQGIPSLYVFLADAPDRIAATQAPVKQHTLRHPEDSHPASQASPFPALGAIVTPALPALGGTHRRGPRQPLGRSDGTLMAHRPGQLQQTAAELQGMEEREECIPFDWRQVQLRQDETGWKLVVGSSTLASLGQNEEDAQLAYAAVRHYRFNELVQVGRPAPCFSYFLVNGQPPQGVMFGLRSQAFQPDSLAAQQIGQTWAVCSGNQVLIQLGSQAEEAQRLVEVLQRLKMDRLCTIGSPGPEGGLVFLARSR